jgi:riboflavin transporter FmnP
MPKNNSIEKRRETISFITGAGVFSALGFIVTLICKIIPNVAGFLSIDAKDAIIAIASFTYGPIMAPVVSLICAGLELVTISTTGLYGFVMNFASSATFSLVASLIYKYRKNLKNAMLGLGVATVATTAVMLLLNIFVTPLYLKSIGVNNMDVISMLPTVLLPFNFAKSLMNGAISIILYKPIITAIRRAGFLPKSESQTQTGFFTRNSIITLIVGVSALAVAVVLILII